LDIYNDAFVATEYSTL